MRLPDMNDPFTKLKYYVLATVETVIFVVIVLKFAWHELGL